MLQRGGRAGAGAGWKLTSGPMAPLGTERLRPGVVPRHPFRWECAPEVRSFGPEQYNNFVK
jgi:hypothetical protein